MATPRRIVLTYHAIDPSHPRAVTPEALRVQFAWLAAYCRVVELSELLSTASDAPNRSASSGERTVWVALAFDDGYADVYDHALPLLREFNLPATVFFVSGYAGAVPPADAGLYDGLRLLSWRQVQAMQKDRICFECHTHHHKRLTTLSKDAVHNELLANKTMIEKETGKTVRYFAFPWGYPNAFRKDMAPLLETLGFENAFTTIWGKIPPVCAENRYFLPRLDVSPGDTLADFQRKVLGYYDYIRLIHQARHVKHAALRFAKLS